MDDNTLNAQADAKIPTVEVENQPQVASDLVKQETEPTIIQEEMQVEKEISKENPQKLKSLSSLDPERIKNLERNGMSKAAAEMYIIKEEKRKMALNAQKEAEQEESNNQQMMQGLQDLDNEKAQVEEAIADAEEVGIDATNLRKRLEEIEVEKDSITASQGFQPFPTEHLENTEFQDGEFEVDPQNPNAPADRQDIMEANADANQVTQQEVDQRADAIKQEHVQMQAEEQVAQDEIARQRKIVQDAQDKLAKEDLELGAIDPDRFWKNKSTGQKIMARIWL